MAQPNGFTREFVARLQKRPQAQVTLRSELPAYDFGQQGDLDQVLSSSTPHSFRLGTGASLYASALLPALLAAQSEVVLVTCFWAQSKTCAALRTALEQLAAARRRQSPPPAAPLRVRICVSSVGLFQKLFHTTSPDGHVYPPSTWVSKLGLPEPAVLRAGGIDLRVKSIFFLPFSVMHPKFLIVDRRLALVPSCNVSWEPWLEGCVEMTGDAVLALLAFYVRTWDPHRLDDDPAGSELGAAAVAATVEASEGSAAAATAPRPTTSSASALVIFSPRSRTPTPTLILPSSHHRNPGFRPFPWQQSAPPPATPLNLAVLQLFEMAKHDIFVQTPNLTSKPAIAGLLAALGRGVNVHIVTNHGMMLLEQLVTAGTTTKRCVARLVRQYDGLGTRHMQRGQGNDLNGTSQAKGRLRISYFNPLRWKGRADDVELGEGGAEEPVHSHFKLTIVDGEMTLLGSGNMDRPSWYTSQELGVLFQNADFAGRIKAAVEGVLEGRLDTFYDSANSA